MSRHSFDPKIAELVGINAAVIYQNIQFWCEKNSANEKNIHEGRSWTYNSRAAFTRLFPYLTEKQIRVALDRLIEEGLILVDNFNEDARDRTRWYAVADLVGPSGPAHWPSGAETLAPEGQPLPDSKPDLKQQIPQTPEGASDLFSASGDPVEEKTEPDRFDEFWKVYPKKAGKPAAQKAWAKAIKRAPAQTIIDGARRYAHWLSQGGPKDFRPIPKFPQGWLNDDRWDDEEIRHVRLPDEVSAEDRSRRFAPQWGEVVR